MDFTDSTIRREMPLVSVVIPCFNAENYLGEALDSVLRQTYPAIEVIAVDDGSTDGTPRILERYAGRIRVLRQANQGSASARNYGIREATGEFVAFLDADDLWFPDKLRLQVAHLLTCHGCGVVYCRWQTLKSSTDGSFPRADPPASSPGPDEIDEDRSGWLYHLLLQESVVHTSTAVFRRAVLDRVGPFDEALRKGQDLDYWLRTSRIAQIHKLSAVLSVYRLHAASITRRPSPVNYRVRVLEKALANYGLADPTGKPLSAGVMRRVIKRSWRGHGYQHLQAGAPDVALRSFAAGLKLDPLDLDLWWLASRAIAKKLVRQS